MWPAIAMTAANILSQDRANADNRRAADQANEKSRWLSANAHQIEVEDLKKAGLNPILSAGGSGAPVQNQSMPTIAPPTFDANMFATLKQLEQQDERIAIDKANSAAQIAKGLSEIDLNKARKVLAQKGMIKANLEGTISEMLSEVINNLRSGKAKLPTMKLPEFKMPKSEKPYKQKMEERNNFFKQLPIPGKG